MSIFPFWLKNKKAILLTLISLPAAKRTASSFSPANTTNGRLMERWICEMMTFKISISMFNVICRVCDKFCQIFLSNRPTYQTTALKCYLQPPLPLSDAPPPFSPSRFFLLFLLFSPPVSPELLGVLSSIAAFMALMALFFLYLSNKLSVKSPDNLSHLSGFKDSQPGSRQRGWTRRRGAACWCVSALFLVLHDDLDVVRRQSQLHSFGSTAIEHLFAKQAFLTDIH